MTLAEWADIATILSVIFLAITFLIDRWSQMIQWGKPYLPKISLAFMIVAIISAGYSYYASRHIRPHIATVISTKDDRTKPASGEMVPFDYEEIIVTKDTVVGLDLGRLKAMETAINKQYMAIIHVEDSDIAYLYTGDLPTRNTKNKLYSGSTLSLNSLIAMKQFRAIALNGTATLAVSYLQGPAK